VAAEGVIYHLNADTKWGGVRAYLDLVERWGEGIEWTLVPSASDKVAFGPHPETVPGFYLYSKG
jgi:hypothetical protein